jgi:Ca2+-binding RTX toxin-like protein
MSTMPATITSANSIFNNSSTALASQTSGTTSVFGGGYLIVGAGGPAASLYLGDIFSATSQTVNIDGAVMAFGSGQDADGIYVFDNVTASVNVGITGVLYGRTNAIDASGQTDVFNAGSISSNSGDPTIRIGSPGGGDAWGNSIFNAATGHIANDQGVAIAYESTGTHFLTNNGTISGGAGFFSIWGVGNSVELITNYGLLQNGVTLGAGDDILDTRKGTITGLGNFLGDGVDRFYGNLTLADTVDGGNGADRLYGYGGNDSMQGGGNNDLLTGGKGADLLTGGDGTNTFSYGAVGDSTVAAAGRDTITDFFKPALDKINVSAIDASALGIGNNTFVFIGAGAFSGQGQIRAVQSGADTLVEFNTFGTNAADMAIVLQNFTASTLASSDFVL